MRFERLGDLHLLGIEVECEHGEVEESVDNPITRAWSSFLEVVGLFAGITSDARYFGVTYDFDAYGFKYLCGVEVDPDYGYAGMVPKCFPASEYAVAVHSGALDSMEDTWNHLYAWVGSENKSNDTDHMEAMEIYGPAFRGIDAGDSVVELYIPVENHEATPEYYSKLW